MIKQDTKAMLYAALMLVLSVMCVSLFFTGGDEDAFVYERGRPWNYPKLRAPFEIPVPYDSLERHRITDSVTSRFVPYFYVDTATQSNRLAALREALAPVDNEPKRRLIEATRRLYQRGIVANATRDSILSGKLPEIRLLEGNEMITTETSIFLSEREAYSHLDSLFKEINSNGEKLERLQMTKYLQPTVVCDTARTNENLQSQLRSALAPHGLVLVGETIIDNGDIVTPQRFELLKEFERMSSDMKNVGGNKSKYVLAGKVMLAFIILLVFFLYMGVMERDTFRNTKMMLFITIAMLSFVAIVGVVVHHRLMLVHAIPFALVAIMVSLFTCNRIAIMAQITMLLLCALLVPESTDFIIMQFNASVVALLSIKGLTQRSQLVRAAFYIFLCYGTTYLAQCLITFGEMTKIDWYIYIYFAFNAIVLSFAYFIIFIIEKSFGLTSLVTLVELSDINNRLLRELSQVCPGTFQHSLQVANLAGEAALLVGGNVQMARTGALYHDIGKIDNPAFFTENQRSVNPHDALLPEQSAGIIIQHVNDGLKRAAKANLPQVVRDFIAQHHGKGLVKFFYNKACKAAGDTTVDTEPYTYPGPNPQTKETAIVMMADACEAACKSLPTPNEESIRALVTRIIEAQIADGMLREAPISFKEIDQVKECLIERLNTIYHTRVSYPDDIKLGLKSI